MYMSYYIYLTDFFSGRNRRTSGWQLSYISALFVGVIVTVALYFDLWTDQFQ